MLAGFAGLATFALGVPIGSLGYWLIRGGSTTLPPASIWAVAGYTLTLGAAAAAAATLLALPVALLAACGFHPAPAGQRHTRGRRL